MFAKFIICLFVAGSVQASNTKLSSFSYSVADPHTGDFKNQVETRQGDHVHGQYSLLESDGTRRTVDYSAGSQGFNAVVHKDPALITTPVISEPISRILPIEPITLPAKPIYKILPIGPIAPTLEPIFKILPIGPITRNPEPIFKILPIGPIHPKPEPIFKILPVGPINRTPEPIFKILPIEPIVKL